MNAARPYAGSRERGTPPHASHIYIGVLCRQEESAGRRGASYCVVLQAADVQRRLCDPSLRAVMEDMAAASGELVCIARLEMPSDCGGHVDVVWDACRLSDVDGPHRAQLLALVAGHEEQRRRLE